MRITINGASWGAVALLIGALQACSGGGGDPPPTFVTGPVGSGGGGTGNGTGATTSTPTSGSGGTGVSTGGTGVSTGGTGVSTGGTGVSTGGTGSSTGGMDTTGGTGSSTGGSAGSGGGGGGGGGADQPIGHFKMLVYYETRAFPHDSIPKGLQMLQELGAQNDFEVTISDGEQGKTTGDDDIITPAKLAPFDIIFFMNPTGEIFTDAEKTVFKDHLHLKKAFAGVHAATDTEHSWTWYEDLVGEIYDGHANGTPSGTITIEESQKNHPAMAGIQSPWTRNEEWYKFNNRINNNLPGVTILMRYGGPESGGAVGQPLAWTREWEGIRSFYTAVGHAESTWDEPLIRKHVLGGVLWAVGRLK